MGVSEDGRCRERCGGGGEESRGDNEGWGVEGRAGGRGHCLGEGVMGGLDDEETRHVKTLCRL